MQNKSIQQQISVLCDRAIAESEGNLDVFQHAETLKRASVKVSEVGTIQSLAVDESEMLLAGLGGEIFNLTPRLDIDHYLDQIGGDRPDASMYRRIRRYICCPDGTFGIYVLTLPFSEASNLGPSALAAAIAFSDMSSEATAKGEPCFYDNGSKHSKTIEIIMNVASQYSGKELLLSAGAVVPFMHRTELCVICSDSLGWPTRELCNYAFDMESRIKC